MRTKIDNSPRYKEQRVSGVCNHVERKTGVKLRCEEVAKFLFVIAHSCEAKRTTFNIQHTIRLKLEPQL